MTDKLPSLDAYQINWSGAAPCNGALRFGAGSTWGKWFELGAKAGSFSFGTNVTAAGTAEPVKTGRSGMMRGYCNISGNIAVDQVLLTIPEGFRPSVPSVISIVTGMGCIAGLIDHGTGEVLAKATLTGPGYFSLTPWLIDE